MENKTESFVRVDKVDFTLQILKTQRNNNLVKSYNELMKIYEQNILNDIERKRHSSTIKMTRAQKDKLYV